MRVTKPGRYDVMHETNQTRLFSQINKSCRENDACRHKISSEIRNIEKSKGGHIINELFRILISFDVIQINLKFLKFNFARKQF